jgi:hypothetical protein
VKAYILKNVTILLKRYLISFFYFGSKVDTRDFLFLVLILLFTQKWWFLISLQSAFIE